MKPKRFPEANLMIAEEQEDYYTLPAYVTNEGRVIACFSLNEKDINDLNKDREIWIDVLTFGNPLQPFTLHTENPFAGTDKEPSEGAGIMEFKPPIAYKTDEIKVKSDSGEIQSGKVNSVRTEWEGPQRYKHIYNVDFEPDDTGFRGNRDIEESKITEVNF